MKNTAVTIFMFFVLLSVVSCASFSTTESTPTATSTATPAPTATKTPYQVPVILKLVNDYMAGEKIDISDLDSYEFLEFSEILATRLNLRRGANVISLRDRWYFNQYDFLMWDYNGHPDLIETIVMYIPIVGLDPDKNFRVVNHAGDTVTIYGSNNTDWTTVIENTNNLDVDWNNTGSTENGTLNLQQLIETEELALFPVILMDKKPGGIALQGSGWHSPTYQLFQVLTDAKGNPMVLRQFSVIPSPMITYFKENSVDSYTYTMYDISQKGQDNHENLYNSPFHENLSKNRVYYLGGKKDQNFIYDVLLDSNFDSWTGMVNGNDAYSVLKNPSDNIIDYVFFGARVIFERAKK